MLDRFGGEFRSSQTKMGWKHLRLTNAHDSLHYLLSFKGVFVFVLFIQFVCVQKTAFPEFLKTV